MNIQTQGFPIINRVPNIRAIYSGGNNTPERLQDSGLLIATETGVLTAAQAAAFNLLRLPSNPNGNDNSQFSSIQSTFTGDEPEGTSMLGTPVFGRIILGLDGQENRFTDSQGVEGSFTTIELDCALVDIQNNKNVITTNIQGLNQTIKEYISNADESVTITGRFDSVVGVAPIEFIQNFSKMLRAPIPIPVTNYFLNNNNIFYLVVMPGSRVWQAEGGYAYQEFVIEALSDVPLSEMLP